MSLDGQVVQAIREDHTKADVTPAERAMLDYVAKLTKNAYKVMPEDLERLREHGFNDQAILQINLIAAWFNLVNRVADGVGVGK